MSVTKFTPGPWFVREDMHGFRDVVSAEHVIALGAGGRGISLDAYVANAHLIAAAPELYREVELMRDWLVEQLGEWLPDDFLIECKENYDKLEFVLAKARGEGPGNLLPSAPPTEEPLPGGGDDELVPA